MAEPPDPFHEFVAELFAPMGPVSIRRMFGGAGIYADGVMFAAMMEQGQKMAQAFAPAMETVDVKAFEKLFPAMPKELLEMWFGKTFNPEGLDARTRFLVTIAAQTVLGPMGEPQLPICTNSQGWRGV